MMIRPSCWRRPLMLALGLIASAAHGAPVAALAEKDAAIAAPFPTGPRIFSHDPRVLLRKRARPQAERKNDPALVRLFDDADKAMRETPFSVVEKAVLPPSGDKHDYLSLAPYAWPDPRKPNGLPYLLRDGQINPERDSIPDHRAFARICDLTETLGLAYFFSDDERFAAKAAQLLRTFFVAPATRMSPNLKFAQIVRGKDNGRSSGIIDTAVIVKLVDGLGLLTPSKSFTPADRRGLDAWLRDYLTWLRESDLGRKEGRAGNNHGTWYDVEVVALALATGQADLASETLNFARKRRIGRQIDPDGEQPEELRRTRPWHYAVFNLEALVLLANMGERTGVDLWRYQTPDGRSIRQALAWLLPFAFGEKPWSLHDIDGMNPDAIEPALREAAAALKDAELAAAVEKMKQDRGDRLRLLVD